MAAVAGLDLLIKENIDSSLIYLAHICLVESRVCTQYANKFGKLSSDHRTGQGQFSFQSLRKAIPKNAQTTAQLHSSYPLVK